MTPATTSSPAVTPRTHQGRLTGVSLVPAGLCQYGDAIGPDDVLRANFDRTSIGKDGLYLVEAMGADGVEWVGCRRFAVGVGGGLSVDDTGRGDWRELGSPDAWGWRVAGYVEQVYRAV